MDFLFGGSGDEKEDFFVTLQSVPNSDAKEIVDATEACLQSISKIDYLGSNAKQLRHLVENVSYLRSLVRHLGSALPRIHIAALQALLALLKICKHGT